MIVFQVSLSFDLVKKTEKNTEIMISDLYFSEESDYSEEHTSDNENFCSTILQPFHIESEQKKTWKWQQEEETKHIHVQLPIYYILE